jgi:uncharacterized protein (DUF2236 family)
LLGRNKQLKFIPMIEHPTERVELGPRSLLWRWAGDARIGLMGGTIGILQLLHPAIGAGVSDHSDFFRDPFDRIFRSLPRILGVVYDGGRAEATGHKVRDFHRDIKGVDAAGRRYHALDPATYWWAHATFQFMTEQVADRYDNHRLTVLERERLYREGVEWYRRYGLTMRPVPPDRASFQTAWDQQCAEVLEMNPAARWALDQVIGLQPLHLGRAVDWAGPLMRIGVVRRITLEPVRISTIGGLPPVVRERFGIPWSRADQLELDALELAVRQAWRFVPFPLRWHPRALAGWRRARRHAARAGRSAAA